MYYAYVFMHKHARLGSLGSCSPKKKLDPLRSLLRPFLDRTRIVVATWLVDICIKFLAACPCAFTKLADLEFLQKKVLWLAEQQAGNITRRTTGELSSF